MELVYLPDGIEFTGVDLNTNAQNAYMTYEGKKQETIIYSIYLNYRTGSLGWDVDDVLLEEYEKKINGVLLNVKKYFIEENRYIIEFEYHNIYYTLRINNIKDREIETIIENLYFR